MANTRPFAYGGHPGYEGSAATPPLIRRKLDALQQIAASTAVEGEENSCCGCGRDAETGFANGVASVLAWLNGEPPTAELAVLLELEEED